MRFEVVFQQRKYERREKYKSVPLPPKQETNSSVGWHPRQGVGHKAQNHW